MAEQSPISVYGQSIVSLPSILALCFCLSFLQKEGGRKATCSLTTALYKGPLLSPGSEKAKQFPGQSLVTVQCSSSLTQSCAQARHVPMDVGRFCQLLPLRGPHVFWGVDSSNSAPQAFERLAKDTSGLQGSEGP